jgi:hypothetical protein
MTTTNINPVGGSATICVADWKPIPITGLSHYLASTMGDIKNSRTGRVLKLTKNPEGYLFTTLYGSDGKQRGMLAHRAVALAHIDIPTELADDPDLTVHHLNAERDQNDIGNLRWMSRKDNAAERYDRAPHLRLDRTMAVALRERGYSTPQIAKLMGFAQMSVWNALRTSGAKTSKLDRSDIATLH